MENKTKNKIIIGTTVFGVVSFLKYCVEHGRNVRLENTVKTLQTQVRINNAYDKAREQVTNIFSNIDAQLTQFEKILSGNTNKKEVVHQDSNSGFKLITVENGDDDKSVTMEK